MMKKGFFVWFIIGLVFTVNTVFAQTITIVSGAGYKRPLIQVAKLYEEKTGHKIDAVFGNMSQIASQAKMSGKVAVIFGDRHFFDKSGILFSSYHKVGKGTLVLAYRKGLQINMISDIETGAVKRLALPDSAKAIYGLAAVQYLKNTGLYQKVENKCLTVSTVPQVSSYLILKEVDAGFINLTDAIGIKDQIGGYLEADRAKYSPIQIEAGVVKGFENSSLTAELLQFLKTPEVKKILEEYGL